VHLNNLWGERVFGAGPDLPVFSGKLRVKLTSESGKTLVEVKVRHAATQARANSTVDGVLITLGRAPQHTSGREGTPSRGERRAIRCLTAILVVVSMAAALQVGVPKKVERSGTSSTGTRSGKVVNDLPATAAGQTSLYRFEVGLAVFFAGLLVLTPAFVGVIRGRLPIEMSLRGWKFGEEAAATDKAMQASVRKIENRLDIVEPDLAQAKLRIKKIREHAGASPDA
jgi:hypothetical protein